MNAMTTTKYEIRGKQLFVYGERQAIPPRSVVAARIMFEAREGRRLNEDNGVARIPDELGLTIVAMERRLAIRGLVSALAGQQVA